MGNGIDSVGDPPGGAVSSDVRASGPGGKTSGASNELAFAAALEKSSLAVAADGSSPGEEAQQGQEPLAGLVRASGFMGPEAFGGEPPSGPVRYVDSLQDYFASETSNRMRHVIRFEPLNDARPAVPGERPFYASGLAEKGDLIMPAGKHESLVKQSDIVTLPDGTKARYAQNLDGIEVKEPLASKSNGKALAKPGDWVVVSNEPGTNFKVYREALGRDARHIKVIKGSDPTGLLGTVETHTQTRQPARPSDGMHDVAYTHDVTFKPGETIYKAPGGEVRVRQPMGEAGPLLAGAAVFGAVQGQFEALRQGEDVGGVAKAGAKGVVDVALPGLSHGYSDVIGDGDKTPVDRILNFANDASGTAFTGGVAATAIWGVGAPVAATGGLANVGVNLIKAGVHVIGADGPDQNPGYIYGAIAAIPQVVDVAGQVADGVVEQIASPDPEKTPMLGL